MRGTVGAGDATVGGFLAGMLRGLSLVRARSTVQQKAIDTIYAVPTAILFFWTVWKLTRQFCNVLFENRRNAVEWLAQSELPVSRVLRQQMPYQRGMHYRSVWMAAPVCSAGLQFVEAVHPLRRCTVCEGSCV